MKSSPAPESDDTATLRRRNQEPPELMSSWNWERLCVGGQMPKFLPMKAGKSISNVVMNTRNNYAVR